MGYQSNSYIFKSYENISKIFFPNFSHIIYYHQLYSLYYISDGRIYSIVHFDQHFPILHTNTALGNSHSSVSITLLF